MIELKKIQTSKMAGQYDYKIDSISLDMNIYTDISDIVKCDFTYYQISNYNNKYWVVYETNETINGTPHNWMVVNTCPTFKEAKRALWCHINEGAK